MTLSTDIIDRLARSLKPFWHYTQHDVIGDAMAEITKLRAERDAAARDMVTVPRAFLDEVAAIPFFKNRKIEAIVREANALRALPDTPAVIATDEKDAT
jgi:hypothetical protein